MNRERGTWPDIGGPGMTAVHLAGKGVRFRIASPTRKAALAELVRIRALVEAHGGAWLRLMGPCEQDGEWITHVVLREATNRRQHD
jgi:hypothetical protein